MPPHVRRRRARRRSNTPRHAVPARAGLSLGRSQRLMKAKCVALIEFCKRLPDQRIFDVEIAIPTGNVFVGTVSFNASFHVEVRESITPRVTLDAIVTRAPRRTL